jgi:hypothetical protein
MRCQRALHKARYPHYSPLVALCGVGGEVRYLATTAFNGSQHIANGVRSVTRVVLTPGQASMLGPH